VRLIALTGCRPVEAMKAQWSEFDKEPGFWIKPSAHTKQRREHKTALAPPVAELIDKVRSRRKKGEVWVFPGQRKGQPLQQLRNVWDFVRDRGTLLLWAASPDTKVRQVAKAVLEGPNPSVRRARALADKIGVELNGGLETGRRYDLRHSFASVGVGHKLSLPIIGKLLGHTQSRTTQRYAHLSDDVAAQAAAQIAATISGNGKQDSEPRSEQGVVP
jgi:integrase